MQSKLEVVKEMLVDLVNKNIIKEYEIKESPIIDEEQHIRIFIKLSRENSLNLPLHSAYWYLQGIVDAQDLIKTN